MALSAEKLCEPCQQFLRRGQYKKGLIDHHPDAASFQNALNLPCSVCTLIGAEENGFSPDPCKTQYSLYEKQHWKLPNARQVNFVAIDKWVRSFNFVPLEVLANSPVPSTLSVSTGSASAVRFLKEKFEDCCMSHGICRVQEIGPRTYPTRLIDVGKRVDRCVRLCEMYKDEKKSPYFCLSHCWGKKQPYVLTKKTRPELEIGVPLEELPTTFRDAVQLTREFNVQYLWIDSLCIFQDDLQDWSLEAGRMRTVYSNAVATIAATAAKNGDQGLFFQRDSVENPHLELNVTWAPNTELPGYNPPAGLYGFMRDDVWERGIERAPLNKRAWVVQERHLSRRTMHFGATQLFWECHETRASERYPYGMPGWLLPNPDFDPMRLRVLLHEYRKQSGEKSRVPPISTLQRSPNVDILYDTWAAFRFAYSSCEMTKEEDKLVALQGIATEFGETLGDQLIAGLWRNRILEELCWKVMPAWGDPGPQNWRAPTWSWASTNKYIVPIRSLQMKPHACRSSFVEQVEFAIEDEKSGRLLHASMRFRCKMLQATVEYATAPGKYQCGTIRIGAVEVGFTHIEVALRGNHAPLFIYWDRFGTHGDDFDTKLDIYLVAVYGYDLHVHGLLICRRDNDHDTFERIGAFKFLNAEENLPEFLNELKAPEMKTITLV